MRPKMRPKITLIGTVFGGGLLAASRTMMVMGGWQGEVGGSEVARVH